MVKKDTKELVKIVAEAKDLIEVVASKYLEEYAEYGFDDVVNDCVNMSASLEALKLKIKYQQTKEQCEERARKAF